MPVGSVRKVGLSYRPARLLRLSATGTAGVVDNVGNLQPVSTIPASRKLEQYQTASTLKGT